MDPASRVDIALIVPKADELIALEVAFDLTLGRSSGRTSTGHSYWRTTVRGLSAVIVELNDQTNSVASTVATAVLHEFDPTILLLLGTGMGREGKINLFDVVYSERVVDLQEWNLDDSTADPRPRVYEATSAIEQDAARLSARQALVSPFEGFEDLVGRLPIEHIPDAVRDARPKSQGGSIAAVNSLIRTVDQQPRIWGVDGRLKALDMESGGFANAVATNARDRQWLAIRGISDFGTRASKVESYRPVAALSAALFARRLLEDGLVEADPLSLRPQEVPASKLSEDNFYALVTFGEFAAAKIREATRLSIDKDLLDSGLTLEDLVTNLLSGGLDPARAKAVATDVRESYFAVKYRDYDDSADLRSLIPDWHRDVDEIVRYQDIRVADADVICVGVGNGRDLPHVCPASQSLVAVDVSAEMLGRATEYRADAVCFHTDAETLDGVPSDAFDVYLSLRVFQSSLLSRAKAVRQARRVLRKGGLAVISIPDAYVDSSTGTTRIVRGLLVGGRVEHLRAYEIALNVIAALTKVGFQSIGISRKRADIYVWAVAP